MVQLDGYNFDLERFMSREDFDRIKEFASDKQTPFLVLDLEKVGEKYDDLTTAFPFSKVYYAIKANPHDEVLKLLAARGSCFDFASPYELDQIMGLGVTPDRLSYGNTIKKAKDIAYAYSRGVRLFATDSENDLRKIAENAPGSKVFFRLLTDGSGADWPLSRKFGAHQDVIISLIDLASKLDVEPYGVSFHVGSQQRDIGQWDNAISSCWYIFDWAREMGIELKMINMGGGFPAMYQDPNLDFEVYRTEITRFLKDDFGDNFPEIIIEPGRSLVGDAGVLVSEVVLISKKAEYNQYVWVYLDTGKFGGLIETLDEAIKYPIFVDKEGQALEAILAGPTCDSMDILYENFKYTVPDTMEEGDRMFFFTTGAYTTSYCSINFNGFPPLKAYILPQRTESEKKKEVYQTGNLFE